MDCLQCGRQVGLSDAACKACGTVLDANGDGIPDALEKLIEEKARKLVAEAKAEEVDQAEANRATEARSKLAEEQAAWEADYEDRVAKAQGKLEETRRDLAINVAQKRTVASWGREGPIGTFLVALFLAAVFALIPCCVETTVCSTSIAGPLFCRFACPTCTGPGRVFTWSKHTGSRGGTSPVSTILCNNPTIDVAQVSPADISRAPVVPMDSWRKETGVNLADYEMSTWWSYPAYVLLLTVLGFLTLPFVVGRARRRKLDEEQDRLRHVIAVHERVLAPDAPPQRQAYR